MRKKTVRRQINTYFPRDDRLPLCDFIDGRCREANLFSKQKNSPSPYAVVTAIAEPKPPAKQPLDHFTKVKAEEGCDDVVDFLKTCFITVHTVSSV